MKVNNTIGPNLAGIDKAKNDKSEKTLAGGNKKTDANEALHSAKINLSEKAQMMNKAKSIASKDMDSVNEEKIAKLQKLIDEGRYNVKAGDVADKLVDEHLLMPTTSES